MKVSELIEELSKLPQDVEAITYDEWGDHDPIGSTELINVEIAVRKGDRDDNPFPYIYRIGGTPSRTQRIVRTEKAVVVRNE